MSDLWSRLQKACERLRPNVPRGGLNPPATAAQIRTVERLVGYRFPDELREAYRHFNGTMRSRNHLPIADQCPPLLLPYFHWCDLGTMARTWVMLRKVEDEVPAEDDTTNWTWPQRPGYHHAAWLPIGDSGTSDNLMVDLDPTRFGRVGQVLRAGEEIELVSPSLNASLERLLDAIDAETLRWANDSGQWVNAAGDWVHDITAVTGPWPPLVPGGTRRRLRTIPPELPPVVVRPEAFATLGASMQDTMMALLRPGQPVPARGAYAEQIAYVESVFGCRLPLEAAACWSRLDGAHGRYPFVWFSLKDATLEYRDWQTWAALEAPLAESAPSDDGRVRPGPWRAGWIPVGEHHRHLFCLDMDPGHGGTPGQLIKIERPIDGPWAGRPSAAPGRVADGLAPWLWQLATEADSAAGFGQTPAAAAWQALRESQPLPASIPPSTSEWSLQGWEPDPAIEGPKPFLPRLWLHFKTLRDDLQSRRVSQLGDWDNKARSALTSFNQWARGRTTGRALVVAPIGAGTSSLLRHGFAKMRQAWQADPRRPLPVLIDAARHAGVTSLQALLDAEAQCRGASAQGMVQALSSGRCALIVDHVEALLPAWPGVWTACDVIRGTKARVMFVCANEVFSSMSALSEAFDAYCAWSPQSPRDGWLAVHSDEQNPHQLHERRCRKLGLKVKGQVFRSANPIGKLGALLGFLVLAAPYMVRPPAGDPTPAAMRAWWQYLAARQTHCTENEFVLLVLAALLHRWQPAARLPMNADERLRPWLCAALGARAQDGAIGTHNGIRLSLLLETMMQNDDVGFLTVLQFHLAEKQQDDMVRAEVAANLWWQFGNAQPWRGAARLLLQPQPPGVAGFLLALGHALAAHWEDGMTGSDYLVRLEAGYLDTLPHPLSRACTAGADLRGQPLAWAQLSGIDLRGACLDGADLASARLEGARLDGASMQATRLEGAHLQGATLDAVQAVQADISKADLRDVSARGFSAVQCDLRQAQWNARWPEASFTDCATTDDMNPANADAPIDMSSVPAQALPPWRCAAVSPCGRFVAIGGAGRTLSLHDTATLAPRWCERLPDGEVQQLCFDAETSQVLALLQYGDLCMCPVNGPATDPHAWPKGPILIAQGNDICDLSLDPVHQAPAALSSLGIKWYRTQRGYGILHELNMHGFTLGGWTSMAFAGPPAVMVASSEHGVFSMDLQGVREPALGWHRAGPSYPLVGKYRSNVIQAVPVRWAPSSAEALALSCADPSSALLAVRAGPQLVTGLLSGTAALWQTQVPPIGKPMFSPAGRWLACGDALFEAATGQRHGLPGPVLAFLAESRALVATTEGGQGVELPP